MQDRQTIPVADQFAHEMGVLEDQLKQADKKLWNEHEIVSGAYWRDAEDAQDWSEFYRSNQEDALNFKENVIRTLEFLDIKPLV